MIKSTYKTLVLVLSLNLIASCSFKKEEEKTNLNTVPSVVVTKVKSVEYSDQIKATGRVSFNNEYKMSFKTGGIVKAVYVKEGQKVKAGTLLAIIKPNEIEAKTSQANIAVEKAKRDYNRTNALYKDSVATLEQLQNAESQLKNAEQDLRVAQFNQNESKISAPANGIVQKILIKENEITGAGNPILIFGAESQGKVLITSVSDADIVHLKLGDKAALYFDAWQDTVFSGEVVEIAGMAIATTGTFETKIQINDTNNQLKSGFIGSAEITSSTINQFVEIPIESLIQADKKNGFVYKVENELAVKQEVKVVKMLNKSLLISNGLSENDKIIIEGFTKLKGNNISVKSNH